MSRAPYLSPKTARRLKRALITALFPIIASFALAENSYWTEFGRQPVYIQQNNFGNVQTLKFTKFKDGMLIAELDGGVGEISLPVSESMAQSLTLQLENIQQAREMMANQNYVGALAILRPQAYPLIKFHQVPDTFTQLHVPVQMLIESLILSGELDEALDILQRIQLDTVSPRYSQYGIRLLNLYMDQGDIDHAVEICRMLPVKGQYAVNISPIIDAADKLRAAGRYAAVIPIYREVETFVEGEALDNIRMWLAYSLVLNNQLEEGNTIFDKLEEPDPKERLFSLYKLLQGSREYRKAEYGKALDNLTRGFVRARTSYVWVPEMLYLIGDCYARDLKPVSARNVWTEITILYPDSPWAARASSSLEKLSTPETSTN
ncbi:tetratricopeptide repeat protein [Coraliomargarita parva]|uniref:tetratricopeptide repeat protein n=1 Tax=Coraliomargarita parva TaxID=3014050 RepID=UPI0022B35B5F|nr:tetratricopeptide repeat protein [Coraliomargarita parva]